MLMALTIVYPPMPGHHKDAHGKQGQILLVPIYYTWVNPNLPGLFCELKFLGGGGGPLWPPPKISTMDGPINLKIGTDTE